MSRCAAAALALAGGQAGRAGVGVLTDAQLPVEQQPRRAGQLGLVAGDEERVVPAAGGQVREEALLRRLLLLLLLVLAQELVQLLLSASPSLISRACAGSTHTWVLDSLNDVELKDAKKRVVAARVALNEDDAAPKLGGGGGGGGGNELCSALGRKDCSPCVERKNRISTLLLNQMEVIPLNGSTRESFDNIIYLIVSCHSSDFLTSLSWIVV
ncbi:hypothetical protein FOCC_FOCC008426 [Frankliniella occidentalis]|nr:hypothetical protein FOCC_FOCC008426 [Frankliniella occidentalis]